MEDCLHTKLTLTNSVSALGVSVLYIRGKTHSDARDVVTQAARVASTIWPIAFAAVIGPMIQVFALDKAERGTSLGMLEMLMGSQTLVSTIKSCYSLRLWGLWAVLLIALWTLSPVGGQAILRSISLERSVEKTNHALIYHPVNNITSFSQSPWVGPSGTNSLFGQVRALFGTALSSFSSLPLFSNGSDPDFENTIAQLGGKAETIKAIQTDVWGNVRIPFLQLLPGYNRSDLYQWVNVPTEEVPPYESLIGVPIRGLPMGVVGNMTLQLSTFYTAFKCTSWTNMTTWLKSNHDTRFRRSTRSEKQKRFNITSPQQIVSIFMDVVKSEATTNTNHGALSVYNTLVFGTSYDELTTCTGSNTYVDTDIFCSRAVSTGPISCTSKRVRHSKDLPIASDNTVLTTVGPNRGIFAETIPWLAPSYHPVALGLLEKYLVNPSASRRQFMWWDEGNYSTLPMEVFQARLGLIFNTVVRLSMNTSITTGNGGLEMSTDRTAFGEQTFANTTGEWSYYSEPHYKLHRRWFALYAIATSLMTLCALYTIYLKSRIRAPDFLGNISALTRDSACIDVPEGGTGDDGVTRAKLLKDKWVRIQDVQPDEAVGKIAFSDTEFAGSGGRLDWDRLYR
ncbi:uncharacterized protein K452DRAFT_279190 [Aplosporella prunicola CBS 121167]|uniref:Uncharacterized protein n=1 Tax=Aplosporella prunicola CBS 121167 TaxID=1176127 RepID=A0A6A6B0R7_9PEZI|nr:uncharacterized protein K452DRAFT_279190 [Aplosporella prunicola CBS 121167]KAF2137023.1 hypothetical protein K452DRAFT_279190 [Aplosporella prunicola CBS 121167]